MKKLFILAITTAALASCSESDLPGNIATSQTQDQAVPVAFSTYIGETATRAGATGAIGTTELQSSTHGFGVFAYNTGATQWETTIGTGGTPVAPNFMYNQKVTYNNTSRTWTYEPLKYWPNGKDAGNTSTPSNSATEANKQYLSFFAYAPYAEKVKIDDTEYSLDVTSGEFKNEDNNYSSRNEAFGITKFTNNTQTGAPTVTYKLASTLDAASNVDLLWGLGADATATTYIETDGDNKSVAVNGYNTDLTKQSTAEKVKFFFKHALAKIGDIQAMLDIDGNTETQALDDNSNVTIQSITISNGTNNLYSSGTLNLATGEWSDYDYATEGALSATINTSTPNCNTNIIADAPTNNGTTWTTSGLSKEAQSVYAENQAPEFFLIPSSVSNQTIKVTVAYTVKTKDNNVSEGYTTTQQTITNSVSLGQIENNKKYSLILHIGMTSVKFEATVMNWDDAIGDATIWLPSNVVTE